LQEMLPGSVRLRDYRIDRLELDRDEMGMGLLIDIFCPTGWWMGSTRFLFFLFGAGPPVAGLAAAPVDPSGKPRSAS
jgi:hypothetical protein